MADDIRVFDFETGEVTIAIESEGQDIFPMWHGDKIFFLSNRDRTLNLFEYDLNSGQTRKVTNYTDYDIKFPSLGDGQIAYENGGFIYIYDIAGDAISKLDVRIADDFFAGRNEIKDASKSIREAEVSPDGKRILFSARGDVFTVPAENGITRNLTETSGVHERDAVWSPDGKWVAYISDASGEFEIYIEPQDGLSEAIQLTDDADTYKYEIEWSPDSKKILWADKKLRLQYVDIDSKKVTQIGQEDVWEFFNYNWSPDSKWIVYTAIDPYFVGRIELYNLDDKESYPVTGEWYTSGGASFSDDGKYVVFTSQRDFNPTYSQTEWNHAYQNMSRIYLVLLSEDTENPFAPENDEVEIKEEENGDEESDEESDEEAEEEDEGMKVDIDGIGDRIIGIPVSASNYWGVECVGDVLYYNENKQGGDGMKLKMYNLKKKKEEELGKGMGFEISHDGKKMLIAHNGKYAVINVPKGKIKVDEYADLSNMKVYVNNKEEWDQIYFESWRQVHA